VTDAATTVVDHDGSDLLALTEALCRVPSVFPDERVLADAVEARVRARASGRRGRVRVDRVANNVVARTDLGLERRIVLGGHLDTVPANGNAEPRRERDTLHGLGTADMKGGLAAMLRLADQLGAGARPRFDVTLVWYEAEEVADEHNGLRHLFRDAAELVAGDFAILLEPTGGWVEAGCQGSLHMQAIFRGARAHTARPWMGVNAVHKAAPVLERIAAHVSDNPVVDGLEFREALQVVRVEAGVANNVVPDECTVVVNRRVAPNLTLHEAETQVRAFLDGADEVAVVNGSPPAAPNLSNPLVAEFVGTLDLAVRPKLGWTDVARFANHGIPAINFGPGDPTLAHTAQERVERADVEGCHRVLAHFLGV
jgi:succinyl-diaminopimelate desuccinylase